MCAVKPDESCHIQTTTEDEIAEQANIIEFSQAHLSETEQPLPIDSFDADFPGVQQSLKKVDKILNSASIEIPDEADFL